MTRADARAPQRGARSLFGGVLGALLALLVCAGLAGCGGTAPEEGPVVVSMGDSYSSGEGNDPFYGQGDWDKTNNQDWLAHRSEGSWPGQLTYGPVGALASDHKADPASPSPGNGNTTWYFLASSGARTENVSVNVDESEEVNGEPRTKAQRKEVTVDLLGRHVEVPVPDLRFVHKEKRWVDSQGDRLVQIARANGGSVDYVTMTIGGNDIDFSGVITSAVLDIQCLDFYGVENKLNEAKQEFEETARANIKSAYVDVSEAAGPDSHVIVAGYPTLLDAEENHFVFHRNQSLAINNRVEWFNAQLELLVEEVNQENGGSRGEIVFVPVADEFRGHEAYTDEPFINEILIPARAQDLTRLIVSSYSMHPNEAGMAKYAGVVQDAIDEIEGRAEDPGDGAGQVAPSGGQASTGGSKDVTMVLDVSGSMAGRPLEETKSAAGQFVDVALGKGAECSLVTYDDTAETLSGFTGRSADLRSAIFDLGSGGGTNIEDGLARAADLVSSRPQGNHYIVLMSDGEPNEGLEGDELVEYARSIRDPDGDGFDDVMIYTLGFNEDASGQDLLRRIASDACFFSVQDAEDLEDFFAEIGDSIDGVRFMYLRLACPVDVTVTHDGETLSSAGEDPLTRTSFGSLSFEEEVGDGSGGGGADGDGDDPVKVLRLREGASYDVSISGYDTGSMDYSIGFVDERGRYSDFRTFSDVAVTASTRIDTAAEVADSTTMRIDDNGDGQVDRVLRAAANEEARLVDNSSLVMLVLAAYGLAAVAVAALVVRGALARG